LLRNLLADNVERRPVYVVGPANSLLRQRMQETLAPYVRLVATNLPGWRLPRGEPPLEQPGVPTRTTRATFGDAARLIGYDAEPFRREGVPLLRMRYYWEVRKPAPPAGLKVWVLFTDGQGNFLEDASGQARFHNTHMLGQGRPLPRAGLPRTICETFDVVVPEAEADRPRRLRVGLSSGGEFLPPIESPGERFADAGGIGGHGLTADAPGEVSPDIRTHRRTAAPPRGRREARS
jgi:hypothetical protein